MSPLRGSSSTFSKGGKRWASLVSPPLFVVVVVVASVFVESLILRYALLAESEPDYR